MDPRILQRRVDVSREQGRRRLKVVVVLVVVVTLTAGIFAVFHSPLLAARRVTVEGAIRTPTTDVLRAAGLIGGPPMIDVSPATSAAKVDKLPWVASATVSRHWPDGVTVAIVERIAVATIVRSSGGYATLDAKGRVLNWTPTPTPGLVQLVASVAVGRPGSTLPGAAGSGLMVANVIPSVLSGRVTTVQVLPDGMVDLLLSDGLTATLGSSDQLPAKMEALASVLAGGNLQGAKFVDVSIPQEPTVGPTMSGPS